MPDSIEPGFNDVLNIGVNPEGFSQGLNQLTELYNSWVNGLAAKGIDANKVINVDASTGALGKLSEQISTVQTTMASFAEAFTEQMSGAASTASDTGVRVSRAMREAFSGSGLNVLVKEAVQEFRYGQEEIIQQASDTANRMRQIKEKEVEEARSLTESVAREHGITNPEQLKILEEEITKEIASVRKFANAQIDEYERANNQRIRDEERTQAEVDRIRNQGAKAFAQYIDQQHGEALKENTQRVKIEEDAANQISKLQQRVAESRLKASQESANNDARFSKQILEQQQRDLDAALKANEAAEDRKLKARQQGAIAYARYLEQEHAAAIREDEARTKSTRDSEEEIQRIRNQSSKAFAQYLDQQHGEALRENEQRVKSEEDTQEKIQRLRQQSADVYAKYLDERRRNGQEAGSNPANDPVRDNSVLGNLVGKFTPANILGQVAQLAAYQLEWAAIQGIISGLEAPAKAFFAVVEGGVSYLQGFEERSSILQGVLLQTVTFSKNFSDNIRLAREESERLTANIDTLSAKLNISSQTLQTGLTTFLEAGGRNLTKSNDDALQVSSYIAAALQTQRQPVDSRTIRTTTQNLVQGDPAANDKFALFLGVSTQKLQEMVNHAKEFHDLNEQIIAAAPGLAERLTTAGQRQDALLQSLKLYGERFEGLVTGPAFGLFTKFLQDVLKYLDDNDSKIRGIGEQLGILVGKAGNFVEQFMKANWPSLITVFQTIGNITIDIAASVAQIVNNIGLAVQLAAKFKNSSPTDAENKAAGFANVNNDEAKNLGVDLSGLRKQAAADKAAREQFSNRSYADIFGDAQARGLQISSGAKQAQDLLNRVVTGQVEGVNKPQTEIPNTSNRDIVTKPNNQAAREDLEEYNKRVQETKTKIDELVNQQKELYAEGNTSLAQSTAQSVSYLESEISAVKALTSAYAAKTRASGSKNAEQEARRIEAEGAKTVAQLNNTVASDIRANSNDIRTSEDVTRKGNQQVDIQNAKNQIEERKAAGASELELAERTAEIHREEYRINQENLAIELSRTRNETDRARVLSQINLDTSKQSSVESADQLAIKQATVNDLTRLYSEGIAKNNSLLKQATAEYQLQTDYLNNAYERQQAKIVLDDKSIQTLKDNIALLTVEAGALEAIGGKGNQDKASAVRKQIDEQKGQLAEAQRQLAKDNPTLLQLVFGDGQLDSLKDVFDKGFANGVTDLLGAFATADRIFKDYEQGQKQGGVLGGVGSVLQGSGGKLLTTGIDAFNNTAASGTGFVSSLLSAAGPFVSAIGPAFSLIGSLFTAAAKQTADEMKKQFSQIQENYKAGSINLSQAITQEQNTINETISKLSGEKGGKGELDAILPGMQSSLDQLKQQQKDIFVNMDNSVASLKVQQSYLVSALSTWNDINKQVTEYINAGGSVATAQQYLSLSLQKQKQQAADDLEEAESGAIKDAQNYNDLIKQRTDLIKSYNQQAFGLKNADSIERQQAGSVSRASQLADATENYQDSLLKLNQQVTQAQQRVTVEQQIFNIQTDSASLVKESNAAALYSLQEQVKQWQAIQDIYNGIVQRSDGSYSYTEALGSLLGFTAGFGSSTSSSYTGAVTPITGYTSGVAGGSTNSLFNSGTTVPTLNSVGGSSGGNRPIVFSGAVTITLPNTGDISAKSFSEQLYNELINRNQYAGSSYYG